MRPLRTCRLAAVLPWAVPAFAGDWPTVHQDVRRSGFTTECVRGSYHLAVGSTPSQQLDQQELARRVRRAAAELPEADREVLLMRTFEGLSFDEVGCLLGIDPAAARKRFGRALLRLHKNLSEGGLTKSQL